MKKPRIVLYTAVLSVMVLLAGYTASMADHTGGDVVLVDGAGNPVADNTPYSPRQTCGVCHDYGSGEKFSTHVQGVLESDNKVYWQSYQVKSYAHGVSVGRHSNQGRNEDYSNAQRSAYGDPFFTSSPGMFGKY